MKTVILNSPQKWIALTGILVAFFCLFLLPAGFVQAAELLQTPQPTPPANGAKRVQTVSLEKRYDLAVKTLAVEKKGLDRITEGISQAEKVIAKLKENGENPAALETALANLKSALPAAQQAIAQADAILQKHDGFDDQGKVTDPAKGEETLKAAREALAKVPQTLRPSFAELNKLIDQFWKSDDPEKLEKGYTLLQKEMSAESKRLEQGTAIVKRAEEVIAELKQNGKDPAKIQQALDTFKGKLSEAQKAYDQAAGILKTHAGFDANGKVTDPKLASETLNTARTALETVRKAFGPALAELSKLLPRETKPEATSAEKAARLEAAFKVESKAATVEGKWIEKASETITKAEERIAQAKQNGKEFAKLETLLINYKEQVALAKTAYEKAAAIISTHTGFDANGKVTDETKAAETVKDLHASMEDARKATRSAFTLIGELLGNRGGNKPTAPVKPNK